MSKQLPLGPVSGEVVKIWVVMETISEHGSTAAHSYHTTLDAARQAARGKGYNCDGTVEVVHALRIDGRHYLLELDTTEVHDPVFQAERDRIRQRAMSKLTPEERRVIEGEEDEEDDE